MNPYDQQKIDAIERDRKRREDELFLALLLLSDEARRDVVVMLKHGLPASTAINNVMQRATGAISIAMADAYRDGVRRMAVLSDEVVPQSGLALKEWKDENAGTVGTLVVAFRPAAQDASNAMIKSLSDAVNESVPGFGQFSTLELKRAVREAFDTAGYTTLHPFALNAGTERAIVSAHNNGMFNKAKETDVVTGLRHFTILDGRETDICHERAGLTLPIDDPYWLTGIPQLHWGCRSGVFPTFGPQVWSTTYPTIPPQPGFGYASAVFIQRLRGGLAA